MRVFRYLPAVFVALLPAAAHAACQPSFVEGSNSVSLSPSASFDNQRLSERFNIRVRNDGDEPCTLRIGVGREITGGPGFPTYTLVGPAGIEPMAGLTSPTDVAGSGRDFNVPEYGQVSIPYELRMAVGWGSAAGEYSEDLVFQLLDVTAGAQIAIQRTRLSLQIPKAALIRFAGASGADGPARIEMGPISSTVPTQSPPFALRILSTSAYRIDLASANRGALRRIGGQEIIPYEMSVGRQIVNLSGAANSIQVDRHTSSVGDVHPITIVINPDPTYHAGDYSDQVTVTVTTI